MNTHSRVEFERDRYLAALRMLKTLLEPPEELQAAKELVEKVLRPTIEEKEDA